MAWYWPDLNIPESAKAARMGAVRVSFIIAFIFLAGIQRPLTILNPLEWRLFLSSFLGSVIWVVVFSVIGWGIHEMERAASITGLVLCCELTATRILVAHAFGSVAREIVWIVLGTLFLTCYGAAVRATFAYHRHNLVNREKRRVEDPVRELKDAVKFKEETQFKAPFYYLKQGDQTPYCPRCWEVQQKPVPVVFILDNAQRTRWDCPACKNTYLIEKPGWYHRSSRATCL